MLAPTNSVIQQNDLVHPYTADASNSTADPKVVAPYDTAVTFVGWRTNPAFIGAILVSLDLPPDLLGNYHLSTDTVPPPGSVEGSAGLPAGAATLNAPAFDIDNQGRPSPAASKRRRRVPGSGGGTATATAGDRHPVLLDGRQLDCARRRRYR